MPAQMPPWQQGPKGAGLLLQPCSSSLPYFHLTFFLLLFPLFPLFYNSSCNFLLPSSCPWGLAPSGEAQPAAAFCTEMSFMSLVYDLEEQLKEGLNPPSTSLEKPVQSSFPLQMGWE